MKIPEKIATLAKDAQAEFDASHSFYTEINQERQTNLSYYMQMPMGNEVKNTSQFITSDVRDVVDFYLAQLMEMFYAGDEPVQFIPTSERDVDQADLETKFVNHVIKQENDGFSLIYTWFKDSLIQKNGIVKVYWDDKIDEEPENYENKGFEDYQLIISDPDYQVKKVKITSPLFDQSFTTDEFAVMLETLGHDAIVAMQTAVFEIYGCRKRDLSQVVIENVEPEYFVVSSSHTNISVRDADYCGHLHYYSRNELLSQGYDYDLVMSLPTGSVDVSSSETSIRYNKEAGRLVGSSSAIRSGELVEVCEHYIRDADNNDPKLYCIMTASAGDVVLDYYEVDRPPYHIITPKINPYRFFGDALADELIDLQYARSNLWRSGFDNVKYSVHPRWGAKGDVDLEALNDYTPAGIIPMGADGEIQAIAAPFVADKAFEISALLENMRAERTGFSRETAGLDPAALADSTNFMGSQILNLSQMRVKMVASTFANTGFKSMCEHIRELLAKYEGSERMIQVAGKFIQATPRSWVKNRGTVVKTGLGYAGKMEQATLMQNILALQEKISVAQGGFMGPIVNLDNLYHALERTVKVSGVQDVSSYFTSPEGYEPPPAEKSQAELQMESYERTEVYKADKKAETDHREIESQAAVSRYKVDMEMKVKNEELILKYQDKLDKGLSEKENRINARRAEAVPITTGK